MPFDLTGAAGLGRPRTTPAGAGRPIDPARALLPVGGVAPRTPPSADALLGRSGVELSDLLLTADILEQRDGVAPVALEMGLEGARAALLRHQPGDALAALDRVWSTAQRSEEGWYLRSGALTVMGLPGEGDRIAAEGLHLMPTSLALRLVQSVALVLVGDVTGARAALAPALDASPRNPVLLAQQAVIVARHGLIDDGAELLERALADSPDHPAFVWARGMVRAMAADRTRRAARIGVESDPHRPTDPRTDGPSGATGRPGPIGWPEDDPPVDGAEAAGLDEPPSDGCGNDLAAVAFSRMGVRLGTSTDLELAREARVLVRAFSSGGTMASAVLPEQAHAARAVLSGMLYVMSPPDGPMREATPPAVAALLAPLLKARRGPAALSSGEDLLRLLRRASNAVPAAQLRLVELLFRPAGDDTATRPGDRARSAEHDGDRPAVHQDAEPTSPLVPIRMGLALLAESRETRAAELALRAADADAASTLRRETMPSPLGVSAVVAGGRDRFTSDWTTARLVAEQQSVTRTSGRGAGFVAVLCVSAALAAAINGATVIAVALGIGAAWLGGRRGARPTAD